MAEKGAYILGTERDELHRLGLQHQVWASDARRAWEIAEFSVGQTILDLGCGPGFCTRELAYMVGETGKVIGVDKSKVYIEFLAELAKIHGLNISLQNCNFDDMVLKDNSLDGAYSRWALAWIPNPQEIVSKVAKALKPGGAFVVQEYYDWSTFQTQPSLPGLRKGIKSALKSFKESAGEIDIGKALPEIFYDEGLELISSRPIAKLGIPGDLTFEWPRSFLEIYLPKLVEPGYLSSAELETALDELEDLWDINGASLLCPQMVEHVAIKA